MIPNPTSTMQHHLVSMDSTASTMSPALVSDRVGVENMDGHAILAGQPRSHARPWHGCIPFDQLTRNNVPPFYVRLQDDQVGHLAHWAASSRNSIARIKLSQNWPWDFDSCGKISSRRDSWGPEYAGPYKDTTTGKGLNGGKKVPAWIDPGLPPTYTSSHKVMTRELDALKQSAALKRKQDEETGRNVCTPAKKPRLSNMGLALKRMKEASEQKWQAAANTTAAKQKERHNASGTPQLRDALSAIDALMQSATETETQNAALERMLLTNEAQYVQNMDDMFDEWLAYNEIKRKEVQCILETHAAAIKDRDTKIGTLEARAKRCKARLERAKRTIKGHEARLVRMKTRWAQEQELMEQKMEEMEGIAIDLDALSEFGDEEEYGESTDSEIAESDEAEAETNEADAQADEAGANEAEAKSKAEHKQEEPIEDPQKSKDTKQPELEKPPTDREQVVGSKDQDPVHVKEIIALDDEDESEDEGPIIFQRKRGLGNR